jgi:hypothetical protein
VEFEQRQIGHFKQQAGAELHALAEQIDFGGDCVIAAAELARFIELAIVGQVALRHHALDLATGDHHRAVVHG